jgi:hypothetical protein
VNFTLIRSEKQPASEAATRYPLGSSGHWSLKQRRLENQLLFSSKNGTTARRSGEGPAGIEAKDGGCRLETAPPLAAVVLIVGLGAVVVTHLKTAVRETITPPSSLENLPSGWVLRLLVDLLVLTGIKKRIEKADKSSVNINVKEAHEPRIVTFSYATNAP